jgi:Uncharacterized conserved protein
MTCSGCELKIEKAIKKMEGVLSAKVSYTKQGAIVEYDDKITDFEKIKAVITKMGYSVLGFIILDNSSTNIEPKSEISMDLSKEKKMISKTLSVGEMTCSGCERKIEKKLRAMEGVSDVKASFSKGTVAVSYEGTQTNIETITQTIKKLGYTVAANKQRTSNISNNTKFDPAQLVCLVLIVFGVMTIMNNVGLSHLTDNFPTAKQGMGYFALFVVGMFTSVHCVAMCGGINISQCANVKYTAGAGTLSKLKPSFLYNLGRVISYTIVGGIVGAIGSVVTFSGAAKGAVAIFAGVFMVIMGLNMLNIFPWLRKFNLRMPKIFGNINSEGKGPLVVGLINGLMPCGPLQAMQLYALSTGDPIKGALSMFFFSIGTVPLMFGLGAVSSMLTKKFTHKMMTVSAVLVMILGIGMLSTGMSLSGIALPTFASTNGPTVNATEQDGVQTVTVNVTPNGYQPVTVKAGVPVKLVFHAESGDINGCNGTIIIPKYNIQQKLSVGDTVVQFTPTETGTIPYSCWMGMIRSKITVTN